MLKTILKTVMSGAAALGLLIVPAPEAEAYREVCVHFRGGVGYHGEFRVLQLRKENPMVQADGHSPFTGGHARFLDERGGNTLFTVRDSGWSSRMRVGNTRCVSMDRFMDMHDLVVMIRADTARLDKPFIYRYCRAWDHHSFGRYPQDRRDRRKIIFHAIGALYGLECRPKYVG